MATTRRQVSQGKRRPGLPQRKDQGPYTEPERNRDHRADGRFAKGNGAAAKRAIKQVIRKHLGPDAGNAETESLYRDTRKLYEHLLHDLPRSDAAEVQDLVARRFTTSEPLASRGWQFGAMTPLKIQHRAGHTDFATTQRYIRTALDGC